MIFKNQYYCLIAGLPDITFGSVKLPFTLKEFREMLNSELKKEDVKLLDKYFLKIDNDNLLSFLKDNTASINSEGSISQEELNDLYNAVEEGNTLKNKKIPPYFAEFIKQWTDETLQNENRLWEDLLSSLYMEYGTQTKNILMSQWFELNLNIGNILTAIYSRKYNLNISNSIVGNNNVANAIRENYNTRDFGLSDELQYFDTILKISEDADIYERERRIDKFRWDWLEENTVFDYFNIECVFAYLCKLQILERWVTLNAEEGERVFRQLISKLKGDVVVPEEK